MGAERVRPGSPVRIHYLRPSHGVEVYVQRLVARTAEAIVTLAERTPLARPLLVRGEVVLEPGAPAVWFTFPGAWYDVGRFHRADGRFTGFYTNLLTPVEFLNATTWRTTDLFLDVWQDPAGCATLLDEEEFERAARASWIPAAHAARARAEAERVLQEAARGRWPPPVVARWTLERARARLGAARGNG